MSFLFPLYLLGAAAVGVPIVLHLIRRRTQKRIDFSTLMFLRATPPKLQSRKRLDQPWLLLLRCLALILLALMFARPYFAADAAPDDSVRGGRTVILLDTSASMRRGDLWDRAKAAAQQLIDEAGPEQRVHVMAFDRRPQTLLGFSAWANLEPGRRARVAGKTLAEQKLSWADTDLGTALVRGAESILDDETDPKAPRGGTRRVVLIGDLAEGAELAALRRIDWPEGMTLDVRRLTAESTTNATLRRVEGDRRGEAGPIYVRVTNAADARRDAFTLRWQDVSDFQPVELTVPPGGDRLLKLDRPPGGATTLVLEGDDHDFDNRLYVAPVTPRRLNVLYLGDDDANDPQSAQFYLRRALPPAPHAEPRVTARRPADGLAGIDLKAAHLIVAHGDLGAWPVDALKDHLALGRTLLAAMTKPADAEAVGRLLELDQFEAEDVEPEAGYAMIGRVDFEHELLAPFAGPGFDDFTKIRVWRYRRIAANTAPTRALARYDNGDPAWLEFPVGPGRLVVLTAGWHPADSQLALSSKFVPLIYGVLERSAGARPDRPRRHVGEPIPLTEAHGTADRIVEGPGERRWVLPANTAEFIHTEAPGLYRLRDEHGRRTWAVNVNPAEGRTAPLPLETLEAHGPRVHDPDKPQAVEAANDARRRSASETETNQRFWRWAVLMALGVLMLETWLAGRPPRTAPREEAP